MYTQHLIACRSKIDEAAVNVPVWSVPGLSWVLPPIYTIVPETPAGNRRSVPWIDHGPVTEYINYYYEIHSSILKPISKEIITYPFHPQRFLCFTKEKHA